ncbi:helix-turn-helix transcriptional regulator [Arcobacter arenosus]|uniref:Uncharacterized protein n=1 Tax=Arcobacter arenosus TaxID=2576037 RepID=A0A5R8Y4T4_9BACT|nr:hypothetical protein [Arcobacter arenosus]TLP41076.1 hypothetical protein FDK22_03380 [Arcobacter arenosus]
MSKNESAKENQLGIFEHLSLIPKLFEKIESLELEIKEIKKEVKHEYDLTKRSDVLEYLGISNSTLENMMKDGRFRQGKHFIKNIKGNKSKISFIESAIKEYKEKK